ncbi:MAG: tRNA (adenosine(37)-N6)-threonylcarbamoyltransferase complex dimerization subunit type 1 TsaB [Geobacteraceae bacterium]|nr:tRNA (adenosine(37)-N6)-threonylcarbamoyltransferase complex dimerization subunit type 1 TsaB [Geobacteraceae bacterium]
MKLLVIDTSTGSCSVALMENGRLSAEWLVNPETTGSTPLLRSLDLVLESAGVEIAAIDALGVTLGPGSFTGLRVGIATVKGLSLATGAPVAGFSSLAMLAMNLPFAAYPVCPMLDARKNEVYAALYRCGDLPETIFGDCVASPDDFLDHIREPTLFIGSGALRYRETITARLGGLAHFAPSGCHAPRASSGALLAADCIARGETIPAGKLVPAYIRPSEAEIARMKKEAELGHGLSPSR